MSSPSSEVFGSLRRHKSGTIRSTRSYDEDILQDGVKGDDRETNDQLAPPTANGIRIWYSSYVTIGTWRERPYSLSLLGQIY